jgi:hypothetical protein
VPDDEPSKMFPLPPPWGAQQRDLACADCGGMTRHYGRMVTLSQDDESDRRTGRIAWLCLECGHKHEPSDEPDRPLPPADETSEMFDRH